MRKRLASVYVASRRRHTTFDCDWSSDVCSSDLRISSGVISTWHCMPRCLPSTNAWFGQYGLPATRVAFGGRSEEHTSELQSQSNLVCRLLLEKKKKKKDNKQSANETLDTTLQSS